MKHKFTCVLMLFLTQLFCAKKIEIHLKFNECISCYAALDYLNALPDYEKSIVIAKTDSLLSVEFLENYTLPKTISYKYVSVKSGSQSYCKVYHNAKFVDSFALKHISSRMAYINSFNRNKKIRSFKLPPKLTLNFERLDMSLQNNYVNIYDYTLNKNVICKLDLTKDTISEIIEIKGRGFAPKLFFKIGNLDSVLYESSYEKLKKFGWADAQIESSFLSDSSLFLLLNFPNIYVNPKNISDTTVDMAFYLYEYELLSKTKKLNFIAEREMSKLYNFAYLINNSRPFFIRSNKLMISISDNRRLEDSLVLFSSFTLANKYQFEKFENLRVARDWYVNNNIDKQLINQNKQFYFDATLRLLIDYKKNKIITLKDVNLKNEKGEKYYARDVLQVGDTLSIVISSKDSVELIEYDLKRDKVIKRETKELPDCLVSTLKFYNSQTLAFINKANNAFHLFRFE